MTDDAQVALGLLRRFAAVADAGGWGDVTDWDVERVTRVDGSDAGWFLILEITHAPISEDEAALLNRLRAGDVPEPEVIDQGAILPFNHLSIWWHRHRTGHQVVTTLRRPALCWAPDPRYRVDSCTSCVRTWTWGR